MLTNFILRYKRNKDRLKRCRNRKIGGKDKCSNKDKGCRDRKTSMKIN